MVSLDDIPDAAGPIACWHWAHGGWLKEAYQVTTVVTEWGLFGPDFRSPGLVRSGYGLIASHAMCQADY